MNSSIGTMVRRLEGMLDTNDLSPWEQGFVRNCVERSDHGKDTPRLSSAQCEKLEQIFDRHFSG